MSTDAYDLKTFLCSPYIGVWLKSKPWIGAATYILPLWHDDTARRYACIRVAGTLVCAITILNLTLEAYDPVDTKRIVFTSVQIAGINAEMARDGAKQKWMKKWNTV